jgi:hypothetical protein
MGMKGVSISTISSIDVQGVSLSTSSSMNVQGVSISAATLLKLRTLISVDIIGCRKTKLSMERKMFPVYRPHKYICISVVFRHLRNFPEIFRRFSEISGGFSEISEGFLNGKIKEKGPQ